MGRSIRIVGLKNRPDTAIASVINFSENSLVKLSEEVGRITAYTLGKLDLLGGLMCCLSSCRVLLSSFRPIGLIHDVVLSFL